MAPLPGRGDAGERLLRQRRRGTVPGLAKRLSQPGDEQRAHGLRIAESELGLGRVHVHVDLVGRHRQEQREHRVAAIRHEVAIGRAHRAREQLVANGTPIDDQIMLRAGRPVQRGQAGEAFHGDAASRGVHGQSVGHEVFAHDAPEAREPMVEQPWRAGLEPQRGAVADGEAEGDLGLGESEPLHHIGDGHGLGALGFHEFEPCRRRIEQVAHLDAGARADRRRLELGLAPALDGNLEGRIGAAGAALHREPRHRADGRQRLAAEAKGEDVRESVVGQLRGGVALDREGEVVAGPCRSRRR